MNDKDRQPLLTLTERRDGEPSRIVVAPHTARCGLSVLKAIERCWVALARQLRKTVPMILTGEPDDLLSYSPKRDKIVEGVLLLLDRAQSDRFAMTVDRLTTTMFLADKGHLDAYGRPLFFDNYAATLAGPMGIAAREMLDVRFDWSTVEIKSPPWTIEAADDGARLNGNRAPNMRRLSQSDVDALASALSVVVALDAEQLRLFTHRQPAYTAAWQNGEGSRLDPRLIPDERDDELIDDLVYASRHAFNAPYRP